MGIDPLEGWEGHSIEHHSHPGDGGFVAIMAKGTTRKTYHIFVSICVAFYGGNMVLATVIPLRLTP
jgi:hypothetical protein